MTSGDRSGSVRNWHRATPASSKSALPIAANPQFKSVRAAANRSDGPSYQAFGEFPGIASSMVWSLLSREIIFPGNCGSLFEGSDDHGQQETDLCKRQDREQEERYAPEPQSQKASERRPSPKHKGFWMVNEQRRRQAHRIGVGIFCGPRRS